jgi:hypothetical protein
METTSQDEHDSERDGPEQCERVFRRSPSQLSDETAAPRVREEKRGRIRSDDDVLAVPMAEFAVDEEVRAGRDT